MKQLLYIVALAFAVTAAQAQTIVRGPYLNIGTPESMVVRWRTDSPVMGKVLYGTDENNLSLSATTSSSGTEHVVKISGLTPSTKYYYTITDANDNNYQSTDSERYFQTSPVVGSKDPVNIWVLGDFGNGSQAQLDVRDSYERFTNNDHTDVWVWLGDNAYSDGTDQEYQDKVFTAYPDQFKNSVVWPCPGNHDYGSVDIFNNGPYYDIFTLPTNGEAGGEPSGEEGYYSFDYGNVHFVSLNSEYLPWFISSSGQMIEWLEDDLAQNTQDFTVVYWHKPPYSKGSHDSDTETYMGLMRNFVNPVCEEYGVDLVLTGHSHAYERSYLMKGHHDVSSTFDVSMIVDSSKGHPTPFIKDRDAADPNQGTVYAVVGCGGQLSSSGDLDHPSSYFSTNHYHGSMVLIVDSNLLTARFIDTSGTIRDEFQIQKTFANDTISNVTELRSLEKDVTIYPNPASESLTIEMATSSPGFFTVELLDLNGNIVLTRQTKVADKIVEHFDLSRLAQGNYVARIRHNGAKDLLRKITVVR